jgi:hypothetical protein
VAVRLHRADSASMDRVVLLTVPIPRREGLMDELERRLTQKA